MKKITHNQPLRYPKGIKARWILEGNIRQTLLQIRLSLKAVFYSVKPFFVRMPAKKNRRQTGIYSCLFLSIIGSISIANAALDGQMNGKIFTKGAGVVVSGEYTNPGSDGSASGWCYNHTCAKNSTGVYITGRDSHGISYNMGWESGMYGIVLGKGVVLLLEGTLTFRGQWSEPNTAGVTVTFSSTAEPVSSTGLTYFNGYTRYYSASNGSSGNVPYGYQHLNGTLKLSLWIGEEAGGTYKIPHVTINFSTDSNPISQINGGGEFTVLDPLKCSVSAPPTIDFGTVNLWNFVGNSTGSPGGARKDVLGVVDGNLSISCTSNSPEATAAAKLTLSGTIQTYSNDLKVTMDNTGNSAPATIRSSIKNITPPCAVEGTHFSTSTVAVDANKVSIDQLGVGQTNIPYRFSLCSYPELGINQFGSASAQATITLDWD